LARCLSSQKLAVLGTLTQPKAEKIFQTAYANQIKATRIGNIVYISGQLNAANVADTTLSGELIPVGYRPSAGAIIMAVHGGIRTYLVFNSGDFKMYWSGATDKGTTVYGSYLTNDAWPTA
jgi:hypothetical protein